MAANSLRIFGMGGATCTQRPIMAALENNAAFELKLVDLRKGEQKQPAHLARQPFGVIPALEDGDFSLYESRAITRYDESRGGKLTPKDIKKRALMEQWISLEQGTITPDVGAICFQRVGAVLRGLQPDDAVAAKHAEKAGPALDIMDAHLAKNLYLAGDEFSLADLFYMPYFQLLVVATPEAKLVTSRPHIAAWWKRISERPSWVKTLSYSEFAKKE